MPDGRHQKMHPKVIIGSAYEPKQFERRCAISYTKQPATTQDGARIQSAFMADHARALRQSNLSRKSSVVPTVVGAITVALLFGAWVAQQVS